MVHLHRLSDQFVQDEGLCATFLSVGVQPISL